METTPPPDNEQAALWNGVAGQAWVEAQPLLDQVLAPFEDLLLEAVAAGGGGHVLDVGCGTGSTTLAVARRLGAGGSCVGLDISEPMIAAARARAERVGSPASFIVADAQRHALEPASVDLFISRFGVMFFDDPAAAFANLRRAARDGAELRCVVWRGAAENPFMTTAERAAAPLLPDLPPRPPEGPGQFAFADPRRVEGILEAGGWTGIDVRPIEVTCSMPESALLGYVTRLGPVGRMLLQLDAHRRREILDVVRAAFDPFVQGADVRFTAACWLVGARVHSGA